MSRKVILGLAILSLAACGGGSEEPVGYNFAQHNGTYICYNSDNIALEVPVKLTAADTSLRLEAGGYTATYSEFKTQTTTGAWRFSMPLTGLLDYETVLMTSADTFRLYTGPASDLNRYYVGRMLNCTKFRS